MSRTQGKPMRMASPPSSMAAPDPTDEAMRALEGSAGMVRTEMNFQQAISIVRPRDIQKVEDRCLREAALMGEDFVYAWRQKDKQSKEPDGKTLIRGMSIDGAMILVRNWGNCGTVPELVQETQSHFLLRATFVDLETGYTLARLFRQRKGGAQGGYEVDRQEDISFQIGQSKAIRNVVAAALPSWLIDHATETALSNAAKKYDPPEKHLPAVLDYAKGLGISEAQIVARAGKPLIAWTPYDIVLIRAVFKTIARKESSVAAEFPMPEAAGTAAEEPAEEEGTVTVEAGADTSAQPASAAVTSAATPEAKAQAAAAIAGPPPREKTADEIEAEEAEAFLSAKERASEPERAPNFAPPSIPPKGT